MVRYWNLLGFNVCTSLHTIILLLKASGYKSQAGGIQVCTCCREYQNTHFMFNNFSFLENRAVYEIMWKNIVVPDRQQKTTWRMRIARWIWICNTFCFSTATIVTRTRSMLCYVYTVLLDTYTVFNTFTLSSSRCCCRSGPGDNAPVALQPLGLLYYHVPPLF
jgi:hypothetical protein